jgi:hypothetical protein
VSTLMTFLPYVFAINYLPFTGPRIRMEVGRTPGIRSVRSGALNKEVLGAATGIPFDIFLGAVGVLKPFFSIVITLKEKERGEPKPTHVFICVY